ncbi:MAG: hypothetical protein IKB90_02525 [Alistipes sp.]|nr:hypothetical protein [Alistipes sp.]
MCGQSRWWLRSPNVNNSTNFYNVNTTGTVNNNNNNANNSNGVCFGFCRRYIIINIVTKIRQSNSEWSEIRIYYRRRMSPARNGKYML